MVLYSCPQSSCRYWLFLGLVALLTFAVRVHLREVPLERDEGEYAYIGQLMLQGVPPYRDAYSMKLPGTAAAYAVIMAFFGQTPTGIHLGLALVNAASIILVFLIGRRLLDDITGAAAAAAFALMSLSPSILGLAGHATHFVTLFALAGTLTMLRAFDPRSSRGDEAPKGGRGAGRWSLVTSAATIPWRWAILRPRFPDEAARHFLRHFRPALPVVVRR